MRGSPGLPSGYGRRLTLWVRIPAQDTGWTIFHFVLFLEMSLLEGKIHILEICKCVYVWEYSLNMCRFVYAVCDYTSRLINTHLSVYLRQHAYTYLHGSLCICKNLYLHLFANSLLRYMALHVCMHYVCTKDRSVHMPT